MTSCEKKTKNNGYGALTAGFNREFGTNFATINIQNLFPDCSQTNRFIYELNKLFYKKEKEKLQHISLVNLVFFYI